MVGEIQQGLEIWVLSASVSAWNQQTLNYQTIAFSCMSEFRSSPLKF